MGKADFMKAFPSIATALLLASCATNPVRLYELRDAPPDSQGALAYGHLEWAVDLANEFLRTSPEAELFPAEGASFSLGFTDVLVHFQGEGIVAIRIRTTGWADARTFGGHESHTTPTGFLTGRVTGEESTGDPVLDAAFTHLAAEDMAAVLLRQAALLRELQARGDFNYYMNHSLLGLWPANGWSESNPVTRRAYAVEAAFRRWLAEGQEPGPDAAEEG